MKRLDQQGIVDSWLIAFMLTLLLFIVAAVFGGWAFMGRNDYKTNVDAKVASAVESAQKATSDKKDAEFKEKEKEPYRTYVGPAAYASVSITYPKTWSAYVDETGKSNSVIDGYFNPSVVPALQGGDNIAIRMQVLSTSYAQEVNALTQQAKTGKLTITPYRPDKVSSVTGVRVSGEVIQGKQVSMIILPVRDKTLKVWTEAAQFQGDLDKIVLPNLSFVP